MRRNPAEKNLSAMTLNLRFGLADDGENSWPKRKKAFPAFLKTYQPDFICLQEANDFQADFLEELLPRYSCIGKRAPAPPFWQNNLVFFRRDWHCVSHAHFFLSPTPQTPSRFAESRWPRQCTCGRFSRNGRQLICLSTHFDFKSSVQEASARIIKKHLGQYPPLIPVILCGDFNATPLDPCHAVFTETDATAAEKSGPPAFQNAFHAPYPGTYHRFTGKAQDMHIDWILCRGGLEVRYAEVIAQPFNGRYPSDHFPVAAHFAWCDG